MCNYIQYLRSCSPCTKVHDIELCHVLTARSGSIAESLDSATYVTTVYKQCLAGFSSSVV